MPDVFFVVAWFFLNSSCFVCSRRPTSCFVVSTVSTCFSCEGAAGKGKPAIAFMHAVIWGTAQASMRMGSEDLSQNLPACSRFSWFCHWLVHDHRFEMLFGLLIVLNGVLTGVKVEHCAVNQVRQG